MARFGHLDDEWVAARKGNNSQWERRENGRGVEASQVLWGLEVRKHGKSKRKIQAPESCLGLRGESLRKVEASERVGGGSRLGRGGRPGLDIPWP